MIGKYGNTFIYGGISLDMIETLINTPRDNRAIKILGLALRTALALVSKKNIYVAAGMTVYYVIDNTIGIENIKVELISKNRVSKAYRYLDHYRSKNPTWGYNLSK